MADGEARHLIQRGVSPLDGQSSVADSGESVTERDGDKGEACFRDGMITRPSPAPLHYLASIEKALPRRVVTNLRLFKFVISFEWKILFEKFKNVPTGMETILNTK